MSAATPERVDGAASSFVLACPAGALPRPLYWGPKLGAATPDGATLRPPFTPQPGGFDAPPPIDLLPAPGYGFAGPPAVEGLDTQGAGWPLAWQDVERSWSSGADGTPELVVTARAAAGATTLEARLVLSFEPDCDVQQRQLTVTNAGAAGYTLTRALPAAVALPPWVDEALAFGGRWGDEARGARLPVGAGATLGRTGRRGRPGHDGLPLVVAGAAGFDDRAGSVFAVHPAFSGNTQWELTALDDGTRLLVAGEALLPGEGYLAPGASYTSPAVVMAFAPDGLDGLRRRFHGYARRRLVPAPSGRVAARPIHFNTWEAVYFDLDEAVLGELADAAAHAGVERFVVDDGWFKFRHDARRALGDWRVDPTKFPNGLMPVIERVRRLGLEFGLWVEPEMISPESDLYDSHPEWCLAPGPDAPAGPLARDQLVLDLSDPDVRDHLFAELDALLTTYPIDYLKWDMNRDLAPAARAGRPVAGAYVRGLYDLLARLRQAHPRVAIEGCASGGGRCDYGILAHVHRFWPSDNTDPLDRLPITQAFALLLPPEVLGSHVGPDPIPLTGRSHSLRSRAAAAVFGHMGIEADLRGLSPGELAILRAAAATYKRWRGVLATGSWHSLAAAEPGFAGFGLVAGDGASALFLVMGVAAPRYGMPPPVQLPGLPAEVTFRLNLEAPRPAPVEAGEAGWPAEGQVASGASLAELGVAAPIDGPGQVALIAVEAA